MNKEEILAKSRRENLDEGKKNAEIAERLNVSPETVHTLKKVAYKKLRAFLTDYYYCLLLFI